MDPVGTMPAAGGEITKRCTGKTERVYIGRILTETGTAEREHARMSIWSFEYKTAQKGVFVRIKGICVF